MPGVYAFDAWVDGAMGVPTDARIVTLGSGVYELTLARLDTGELLATRTSHPLGPLEAADWEPSDGFICSIGYPVDERTVTGTLVLPRRSARRELHRGQLRGGLVRLRGPRFSR